jgi:hypothetical protein
MGERKLHKGDICISEIVCHTKLEYGWEAHYGCEIRIIRYTYAPRKIGHYYRAYNITLDRYETVNQDTLSLSEKSKRKHILEKILEK